MILPGSKSITNRALLIAALAKGTSTLKHVAICDDSLVMIQALRELGVGIELNEAQFECTVTGVEGSFANQYARLWCQDSGITLRFLLAVCATQQGQFHFDGSARLKQRPIQDLLNVLRQHGLAVEFEAPLVINASGLSGGGYEIAGNISSQFVSALLIAAPMFTSDSVISVNNLVSQPYVDMTCQMMRDFAVDVQEDDGYRIASAQHYYGRDYVVEPDLSSASYFFAAAGLLGKNVTVDHVIRETCMQGDIEFLTVLEKMGCTVTQLKDSIMVQGPKQLKGIDVDMSNMSDTMMTLAAIAPFTDAPTTITGIGNTRFKESDRIAAMAENLKRVGVLVEDGEDWLKIFPSEIHAAELDSFNDHRIAMSCALLQLKVPEVTIKHSDCVSKTFPEFFEVFGKI